MTRATPPRALLLLLGALAAFAGIVWGAGLHPRAVAKPEVAAAQSAPKIASAPAAALPAPAAQPVAHIAHAAPSTVAGSAGMRIYRDPDSGETGAPSAAESAVLESDANSEDMTGLQQVTLPDGSIMIDLQGRFQESMVMQIDANGNRVVTCTRDVKKTLAHPPVAPAQREER